MRSRVILFASTALLCTGCATVDLQNMSRASTASADVAGPEDSNVVQRAVEKLRAAFASHGFGEKASQRKMHAAADMLLNGLSAKSVSAPDEGYAATVRPVSVVVQDIQLAKRHVEQTARAAEIYLEVAPADRKLNDELESLQAALIASERASRVFSEALPGGSIEALTEYRVSVDRLRTITDEFGVRVRMTQSGKLALSAASGLG